MRRTAKVSLGVVAAVAAFFALHVQFNLGGWPSFLKRLQGGSEQRGELTVGFLPVTCHLTCPVTNWVTTHSDSGSVFRSKKYTDFATVAEEFKQGKLKASFILAP